MLYDLRYAIRTLIKSPGFSVIAVISLTLAIGASMAVFSLVNAVLLRSLPVPNPHELRLLEWTGNVSNMQSLTTHASAGRWIDSFSYPVICSLRDQCAAQADIFGYSSVRNITARARHEAFSGNGLAVSGNFFPALRARTLIGRLLSVEDDAAGAPRAVVISYRWWEEQFDLDPNAIGQSLILNGDTFAVVGVLPRAFPGVQPGETAEFYLPVSAHLHSESALAPDAPGNWWMQAMARVRPGVSDAQLESALTVAFTNATEPAKELEASAPRKVALIDGRAGASFHRDGYRRPLWILLAIVGMVVLAACANLAGLCVARGAARRHDLAVRAALGASRWRIVREALSENLILALVGAGLGALLASSARSAISRLLAGSADGLHYDASMDLNVLGFSLGMAFLAAIVSGLLPALQAARVDPIEGLKAGSRNAMSRLGAARVLVATQVALSLLLLAGAGLFVRTLVNLVHIDPGFEVENLLVFRLDPSAAGYKDASTVQFYERVQKALEALPGVQHACLNQWAFFSGAVTSSQIRGIEMPVNPASRFGTGPPEMVAMLGVNESFFSTLGIDILSGRPIEAGDTEKSPRSIVVNETFVQKYLSGMEPLAGGVVELGGEWRIVGVCRDAKYRNIKEDLSPQVYFSFRQRPMPASCFTVRTTLPPMSMVTAARRAVASIDPNVPLSDIATQTELRDQNISQERLFATLCGSLAVLALLLSCIGLYGLMAYNVTRRTRETGVRMALGATRVNIVRPILFDALLMTAAGVIAAVPIALGLVRMIETSLYGVKPRDPTVFIGSSALLLSVAILAAWFPARRASRVDPMVALRSE